MLDPVTSLRDAADYVDLGGTRNGGLDQHSCVRGQNFLIEWIERDAGAPVDIASDDETILILPDVGATISGSSRADAPRRSLVVLPAGAHQCKLRGGGRACVLSTSRQRQHVPALNAASYARPDQRVAPVGPAWRRTGDPGRVQVFEIDRMTPPADNPRQKMFQSATMSINWVDYDGPRDRSALSPHSHTDFEQASLAIAGDFVHHLRVTWGKNANEWCDDQHVAASSPSVLVIPPQLIHTTEGVGPGHHLLIDVFAPPRRDFIARKWVLNSDQYEDPAKSR